MNNKFTKSVVVGLVVILVLSLGAVAAFAQEDTTPDTDAKPALPFGRGGFSEFGEFGGPRGHHGSGGTDDAALAEALGVTVEELQAAREQAQAQRLAQAVEDGTLTQEQVDSMQAMQAVKEYIDREEILAGVLGLTVEDLEAARADGSLRDLLSGLDIDPTVMQEQMQAAAEAAVQQAVADGVITQAQADLIAGQLANGAGMMGKFGGPGGSSRGRGGLRGFGGAQPDADGAAFGAFQSAPPFGA